MYADRDKRGMASLMEFTPEEESVILEAMEDYKQKCEAVYQLFSYRNDFDVKAKLLSRMINQMKSI